MVDDPRIAALLAATEATSTYDLTPEEIQAKVLDTADEFHAWLVQDRPGQVYHRKPAPPAAPITDGQAIDG